MYLYFTPKSIILYVILAAVSYFMGGLNGLLWFAFITLIIGAVSLIYDYVENKIRKKKEKSYDKPQKAKTIKVRRNHNFKVINGGKDR